MYFKDKKGNLHAIDSELHKNLLPAGCIEITDSEAELMEAKTSPKASAGTIKKIEIEAKLRKLDEASTRPARAVALALFRGGVVNQFDVDKLTKAETDADALRAELKTIKA